jgi:hypothetical protein
MYIYTFFFLRITDIMTSQNTDLSSWDTVDHTNQSTKSVNLSGFAQQKRFCLTIGKCSLRISAGSSNILIVVFIAIPGSLQTNAKFRPRPFLSKSFAVHLESSHLKCYSLTSNSIVNWLTQKREQNCAIAQEAWI